MNKIFLIGTIAMVTIGAIVLLTRSNSTTNTSTASQNTTQQIIPSSPTNTSGTSGTYLEYSTTVFNEASGGKRVLFFYASWCSTCRPAAADFQNNTNKIPSGVTVIRVNYNDPETDDKEIALAKQYGVTYQHTYVQIDETGKEIGKWNGGSVEELITNLK